MPSAVQHLLVAALAAAPAPRALAPAPDSLTGPGVSRALAAYRAARVRDVRYDLAIELVVPLPGFVKRRAEVRILNTVRELKVRAEA